jgi:hypothetical protein
MFVGGERNAGDENTYHNLVDDFHLLQLIHLRHYFILSCMHCMIDINVRNTQCHVMSSFVMVDEERRE